MKSIPTIRLWPLLGAAFTTLLFSENTRARSGANETLLSLSDNTWVRVSKGDVTSDPNIGSYSGGWFDVTHGQFAIFGGGHWDYAGNEVWCLDVGTLEWQLMYESDPESAYNNYDNENYPGALFYPAGESIETARPMSKHTYDQMEWVDGHGVIVFGGFEWGDSSTPWCNTCFDTWSYQFPENRWDYLRDPNSLPPSRQAGDACAAYSSGDGLLYVVTRDETSTYNPKTNTWQQIQTTGAPAYTIESTLVYASSNHSLYHYGGQQWPEFNGEFWRFDIATSTWSQLSPSGDAPALQATQTAAIDYDPVNDVIVIYSGGRIWVYDVTGDSWSEELAQTSVPAGDTRTFGRFRYDPLNHGFWYHDTWTDGGQETWFYKYRAGANAESPVNIVEVGIENTASDTLTNTPVTFGHVFRRGDVPRGSSVIGVLGDGSLIETQVDAKATHSDGSLRHAVISLEMPEIPGSATVDVGLQVIVETEVEQTLFEVSGFLESGDDVVVSVEIGGVTYRASVRDFLQSQSPEVWLGGGVLTEWAVDGPLVTEGGVEHSQLSVRFEVRGAEGAGGIRTGVTIENTWSRRAGPSNVVYDLRVEDEVGTVLLSRRNVTHYRQARWRRTFWDGAGSQIHVVFDSDYWMSTGAVPQYDSAITIPEGALSQMVVDFTDGDDLMEIGYLEESMPAGGGRLEIAPLPRFAVRDLVSQDPRARAVNLGHGEQSGSWSMHYRDQTTGLPISVETYPNRTIVGDPEWFPFCGGNCETPYDYDLAHHPSLAFLPYLVTGDFYFLEELQFWGNLVTFYHSPARHGLGQGLVGGQIRDQAWSLRTLGQTAYITPDAHPLKRYFEDKVQNNIEFFNQNWVDSNPLGYVMNRGSQAIGAGDNANNISTWMDDFLTWSFGYLVDLGFSDAKTVLDWKASFPVGRMNGPDMCWTLASTSWVPHTENAIFGNGSDAPVDTWDEWRQAVIRGWRSSLRPESVINIEGQEDALLAASCGSAEMAGILGIPLGQMIGYQGVEGYPANLQPALAVAVQAGVPGADEAWERYQSSSSYPDYSQGDPQWGVVPRSTDVGFPPLPDLPELVLEHPLSGSVLGNSRVMVLYRLEDEEGDVDHIDLAMNGEEIFPELDLDGSYLLSSVPPGQHEVTLILRDRSGRELGDPSSTTFSVDDDFDGPVLALGFDEGSGSQANDSSSWGNDGAVEGGSWGMGRFGSGLEFDGNAYVEVPDAASLDLEGSSAILAWINPSQLCGWQTIVHKTTEGNSSNYYFDTFNGELSFGFLVDEWVSNDTQGLNLALDEWQHVATTFDSADELVSIYVNGDLVLSGGQPNVPVPNDDPLLVGTRIGSEAFVGMIDEVRIYDRALSRAEIVNTMNLAINPDKTPFEQWKESFSISADISENDDSDRDGFPLLFEYALDLNPRMRDSPSSFIVTIDRDVGVVNVRYRQARADIVYMVQRSGNLTDWTEGEILQGNPDDQGMVTASMPITLPQSFVRLKVLAP